MSDTWFFAKNKQKHGPYSTAQLREFLAQGTLQAEDMVLKEGAQKWVAAASIAPKARNLSDVCRSLLENRLALVGMTAALSIILGIVLGLLMAKRDGYKAEAKTDFFDKGLTSEEIAVESVAAERREAEKQIDKLKSEMEKLVADKRNLDEQLTATKNRAGEAIDARRTVERQIESLKSENEKLVRMRERLIGSIARRKLPDQTRAILDMAPHFDLYSLEPSGSPDQTTLLHGWIVLGKTTVKKAETRKELLTALEKSIASLGRGVASASTRDTQSVQCMRIRRSISSSASSAAGCTSISTGRMSRPGSKSTG